MLEVPKVSFCLNKQTNNETKKTKGQNTSPNENNSARTRAINEDGSLPSDAGTEDPGEMDGPQGPEDPGVEGDPQGDS